MTRLRKHTRQEVCTKYDRIDTLVKAVDTSYEQEKGMFNQKVARYNLERVSNKNEGYYELK